MFDVKKPIHLLVALAGIGGVALALLINWGPGDQDAPSSKPLLAEQAEPSPPAPTLDALEPVAVTAAAPPPEPAEELADDDPYKLYTKGVPLPEWAKNAPDAIKRAFYALPDMLHNSKEFGSELRAPGQINLTLSCAVAADIWRRGDDLNPLGIERPPGREADLLGTDWDGTGREGVPGWCQFRFSGETFSWPREQYPEHLGWYTALRERRSLTQEEWDLAISFADSIEAWMRGGVFER
jgi:hypothetical protein